MSSIAIIGAGVSGLVTAKSAKECGFEDVTVFEQSSSIGGGWRKQDGFIPEGMQTNISRHTCMFSDFEWKSNAPDFPTQEELYEYLCEYANTFKIHPHVRLNSEVQRIQRCENKWKIEWINQGSNLTQTFDYVIVCTGIFSKAYKPNISGIETFKGEILHSKEYKKPDTFEGKTVVVIGNAFSGCEIAASIASKANQVVNVIHRPMWILPRYLQKTLNSKKVPCDLVFYSRATHESSIAMTPEILNTKKNDWLHDICVEQGKISPDLAIATPTSKPPFVAITDLYLNEIKNEKIKIKKGDIKKIEKDTLIFDDGSFLKADALVFCTGYQTILPFFDQDVLNLLGFRAEDQLQPLLLHKTVFPPSDLPGLAFVGLYRGPFFAAVELQARWVCMAFSNQISLPTHIEIEKGIQQEKEIREATPRPQFPHGNYVGMCEDLAAQIGVLPCLDTLKYKDPILYNQLYFGPFTPASYRLNGTGKKTEIALKIINQINSFIES